MDSGTNDASWRDPVIARGRIEFLRGTGVALIIAAPWNTLGRVPREGRQMNYPALATLVLLLLVASPTAASEPAVEPPAAVPDSVQFGFAWPIGLKAQVTYAASRTQSHRGPTPLRWRVRYSVEVQQAGEQLLLRHADFAFDTDSKPEVPEFDPRLAAVLDKEAGLNPDYLVTRAGEFAGLHDLPAFQAGVRSLLSDLLPQQDMPAGLSELLKVATSEDVATAKIAADWDLIVGYWAGSEMEIGVEYVAERVAPHAVVPNEEVRMRSTFAALRRVDCSRGGTPRRCVELEIRSTTDTAWVQPIPELFMSELVSPELSLKAGVRDMQIEDVVRLVTEPDGLIPHSLTRRKTVRSVVSADGNETIERVDQRESTYSYP